jgi:hypothetical protein
MRNLVLQLDLLSGLLVVPLYTFATGVSLATTMCCLEEADNGK